MTDQHDQVQDEVGRALRIAVASAAALADRLARARQEAARHPGGQGPSDVAGAEQLAAARDDAQRWRAAQAPAAAEAAEVAAVIKQRTGLDVSSYTAEVSTVRAALQQVDDQAGRPGRSRDDAAVAVEQVRAADARDRARAGGLEAVDTATLVELYSTAQDWSRAQATGARDADDVAALVGDRTGADAVGSSSGVERDAQERGDVQAAALDAQAARYDWQASEPGLERTQVETLQVLALDARAQADLYRQTPAGDAAAATREPAAASFGAEPVSRQAGYDSHERRLAERDARVAAGVPQVTADTAMQADMARGTPPSDAVSARARAVSAATRGSRTATRTQQHDDRAR